VPFSVPQRFLCLVLFFLYVPLAFANGPDVIKASRHDASPPLWQMAIGASSNGGRSDSQSPTARATGAMITNPNSDPVAAPLAGPLTDVTLLSNFAGQSAQDNRNLFGFAFRTPGHQWRCRREAVRTNGERNPRGVRQIDGSVAALARPRSTRSGPVSAVSASLVEARRPLPMAAIRSCSTTTWPGDGWVTQLQYDTTFTQTAQCVAVSTSSDATGSYKPLRV